MLTYLEDRSSLKISTAMIKLLKFNKKDKTWSDKSKWHLKIKNQKDLQ